MTRLEVVDHCRLLLRGVQVMHEQGLELTRIIPGMAPSGLYWRLTIVAAPSLDPADPLGRTVLTGSDALSWTSGDSPQFAGLVTSSHTTRDDIAEIVTERLGERALGGEDPAYAAWYAGLLAASEAAGTVPVAFSDAWEPHGWTIGFGGPEFEPPPPPVGSR
ncbi:hypothetical protein [Knoellia sp. LjRoot47]|uniref:hypothetical protein n=1 Tax=Knoellia sp. LjRoot47 TaxID=3342330 RepID=UPI003ECD26E6